MTEPSQYFKGRTVQEQMNEVIGYVDVRSAEVATTAIASDVAQVHQDMLDADADAQAAAASAAAAAGTLANAVKKTGEASQSIAGNIEVSGTLKSTGTLYAVGDTSVGGNLGVGGSTNVGDLTATGVVTVPTPTGNTHAANKKYVDDQDALNVKLAGAQTITGIKEAPLEATGTFSNQIASSNKVKNELDNYAPMLRTSGNQTKSGTLKLNNPPILFSPKTIGLANTSGYFKLAKFVATPRYYAIGLITTRGATTAIATVSGALNAGVWTCNSTTLTTGATAERLKIGVCTIDGENYLIAHVVSSPSLNITILGSSSGTAGTLDSLSITDPDTVTPGSDYVEGDFII